MRSLDFRIMRSPDFSGLVGWGQRAVSRQVALFGVAAVQLAMLLGLGACGGSKGPEAFPEGFASMTDAEQVAYMMEQAEPDSVARFICLAAIGRVPGASIDSLPMATLYAYEHYRDSALTLFAREYDAFSQSLPLPDKMKVLAMAGTVDPNGLGYELGLHYAADIREKNMTAADVRREIEQFRQVADSATYERFIKGFQTVLRIDGGRDLPADLYESYK